MPTTYAKPRGRDSSKSPLRQDTSPAKSPPIPIPCPWHSHGSRHRNGVATAAPKSTPRSRKSVRGTTTTTPEVSVRLASPTHRTSRTARSPSPPFGQQRNARGGGVKTSAITETGNSSPFDDDQHIVSHQRDGNVHTGRYTNNAGLHQQLDKQLHELSDVMSHLDPLSTSLRGSPTSVYSPSNNNNNNNAALDMSRVSLMSMGDVTFHTAADASFASLAMQDNVFGSGSVNGHNLPGPNGTPPQFSAAAASNGRHGKGLDISDSEIERVAAARVSESRSTRLTAHVAQLEEACEASMRREAAAASRVANLLSENEQLRSQLHSNNQVIGEEASAQITRLSSLLDTSDATMRGQQDALEAMGQLMEDELRQRDTDIASLHQQLASAEARAQRAESQAQQTRDEAARTTASIEAQCDSAAGDLRLELRQAQDALKVAEEQLAQLRASPAPSVTSHGSTGTAGRSDRRLERQVASAEAAAAAAIASRDVLQGRLDAAERTIAGLQEETITQREKSNGAANNGNLSPADAAELAKLRAAETTHQSTVRWYEEQVATLQDKVEMWRENVRMMEASGVDATPRTSRTSVVTASPADVHGAFASAVERVDATTSPASIGGRSPTPPPAPAPAPAPSPTPSDYVTLLRQRVDSLEADQRQTSASIQHHSDELMKANNDVAKWRDESSMWQQRASDAEKRAESLADSLRNSAVTEARIAGDLEARTMEIESLKVRLSDAADAARGGQSSEERLINERSVLETELRELRRQMRTAYDGQRNATLAAEDAESELSQVRERLAQTEQEVSRLKHVRDEMHGDLMAAKSALADAAALSRRESSPEKLMAAKRDLGFSPSGAGVAGGAGAGGGAGGGVGSGGSGVRSPSQREALDVAVSTEGVEMVTQLLQRVELLQGEVLHRDAHIDSLSELLLQYSESASALDGGKSTLSVGGQSPDRDPSLRPAPGMPHGDAHDIARRAESRAEMFRSELTLLQETARAQQEHLRRELSQAYDELAKLKAERGGSMRSPTGSVGAGRNSPSGGVGSMNDGNANGGGGGDTALDALEIDLARARAHATMAEVARDSLAAQVTRLQSQVHDLENENVRLMTRVPIGSPGDNTSDEISRQYEHKIERLGAELVATRSRVAELSSLVERLNFDRERLQGEVTRGIVTDTREHRQYGQQPPPSLQQQQTAGGRKLERHEC